MLSVVLRDLEANSRRFIEAHKGFDEAAARSDSDMHELSEAQTYCQLHLEAAFNSGRRLADRFAEVLRPLICENVGSLSPKFASLAKAMRGDLSMQKVLVDTAILRRAFTDHVEWFEILRAETDGPKGLRDVLVHQPVYIVVSAVRIRGGPLEIAARLHGGRGRLVRKDELFATLRKVVSGLCGFWTVICESTGIEEGYRAQGGMWIPGDRKAVVGFWPEI
jgi:hypothetical protein